LQLLANANAQYNEIEDSMQEANEQLSALRRSQNLATSKDAESANVIDHVRSILHKQLESINWADREIGN
jgi:hypothetical protein